MNTLHSMFIMQLGSEYPWTQHTISKWNLLQKPTNLKPNIRQLLSCSELCLLQVTHSCFMRTSHTLCHYFHFSGKILNNLILYYKIEHLNRHVLHIPLIKWPSKRSNKCYWHQEFKYFISYTSVNKILFTCEDIWSGNKEHTLIYV
jgi:hypothetical protein